MAVVKVRKPQPSSLGRESLYGPPLREIQVFDSCNVIHRELETRCQGTKACTTWAKPPKDGRMFCSLDRTSETRLYSSVTVELPVTLGPSISTLFLVLIKEQIHCFNSGGGFEVELQVKPFTLIETC